MAGEASGFTQWDETFGQPNNWGGFTDCAGMTGTGLWYDVSCIVSPALGWTYRCLCEGPSSPSAPFEQDLQMLATASSLHALGTARPPT